MKQQYIILPVEFARQASADLTRTGSKPLAKQFQLLLEGDFLDEGTWYQITPMDHSTEAGWRKEPDD